MSYPERSVRDVIAGLAPRSFLLAALAAAIAAGRRRPGRDRRGRALRWQARPGGAVAHRDWRRRAELPDRDSSSTSCRCAWGWLPVSAWDAGWSQRVLPAVTLALPPTAYCARLMRASTIEVLASEHVTAARARGLRRSTVLRHHVARNVAVPLLAAAARSSVDS